MRLVFAVMLLHALMAFVAPRASAFELAGGFAGVEEGDDRYRPSVMGHVGWTDSFYTRGYMYGRKIGHITERTGLLDFSYRFPVYGNGSDFKANFGGVLMLEHAQYKPKGDTEKDESSSQFNAGVNLGIAYELPIEPLIVSFHWDAHLFPAGTSGFLWTTGRKQMVGIVTGIRF